MAISEKKSLGEKNDKLCWGKYTGNLKNSSVLKKQNVG